MVNKFDLTSKKVAKKVNKLIWAVSKSHISDLQLLGALVMIRLLNYDQTKLGIIYAKFTDSPSFEEMYDLARVLDSDDSIHIRLI